MEWSNEKALEFLELLKTEPSLWDPKHKGYKNRGIQNDAWRRIKQGLLFPTTVEGLKKKKESLMGYYRIHLNKYKKSFKAGAETSEVYVTNWFAFELMDSFLSPVYKRNSNLATVDVFSLDSIKSEASEDQETSSNIDISTPRTLHDQNLSDQKIKRCHSVQSKYIQSTRQQRNVKKKLPAEIMAAKEQTDDGFDYMKSVSSQSRRDYDEYDHFGLMIGAKIRKINDWYERESLMNSIHNLVFESISKNNVRRMSSSESEHSETEPLKNPLKI